MTTKILLTGATSGIGLEVAKAMAGGGHHLLVHGRSTDKVGRLERELAALPGAGPVQGYVADLSRLSDVDAMAGAIAADHDRLDVVIHNAGILKTPQPVTAAGLDVRFVVNFLAPVLLTRRLLPVIAKTGRIVNLSSAAQHPVDLRALAGEVRLPDFEAYAQSKLAITAWSAALAASLPDGPMVVAVNPGSLLATKMVREGFGMSGKDVRIGSNIVARAALGADFEGPSGRYFDNDSGRFAQPHPEAMDAAKTTRLMAAVDAILGA